jgi:hypothetical protein
MVTAWVLGMTLSRLLPASSKSFSSSLASMTRTTGPALVCRPYPTILAITAWASPRLATGNRPIASSGRPSPSVSASAASLPVSK